MTKSLNEQVAELHAELARTRSADPELRELLISLLADITRLLGQSTSTTEQQSPAMHLDALAVQFEAEHPALGRALRQVVDTLSKAGI